jgi:hypothetical protein
MSLDPLQFYLMHFMPYPDVVPAARRDSGSISSIAISMR